VFFRNERRFATPGSRELVSSFVVAGAADDATALRVRFFMFYTPSVVKNYLCGKD
jgi:hypothetical protein